ncbi:MAG: DUF378 domain-containing protein [Ruminococcus sp.]|jgi:uncharacterized membrane protein YuzA (DUF378 family)|nr:DUF378 domain-containing protein [Ruminococcus sp.]
MNKLALVLSIIGGLNWLLIGIFGFNFVSSIFGVGSALSRIVYILVGIAAIWCITMLFKRDGSNSIGRRRDSRATT